MAPAAEAMAGAGRCDDPATGGAAWSPMCRAEAVSEPDSDPPLLVEQVTGRVRWRESVAWMAGRGVTEYWEIGAGKALSGMIRRIDRAATTRAVGTPDDVAAAMAAWQEDRE
jgi:[acyl-carrier-protein] S-malonyltransferase